VITGPTGADSGDTPEVAARGRQVTSTTLFRGEREIVIVHRGQEYHLRITKSDKLILTK
jgi:hemin uptake protein HemP